MPTSSAPRRRRSPRSSSVGFRKVLPRRSASAASFRAASASASRRACDPARRAAVLLDEATSSLDAERDAGAGGTERLMAERTTP